MPNAKEISDQQTRNDINAKQQMCTHIDEVLGDGTRSKQVQSHIIHLAARRYRISR